MTKSPTEITMRQNLFRLPTMQWVSVIYSMTRNTIKTAVKISEFHITKQRLNNLKFIININVNYSLLTR